MGAASFTPGPWMAASAPSSVVGWPVVGPMGRSICNVSWMPRKAYPDASDADYAAFNAECEANARLIAEAGTVAHETGLTPRRLADAYAQLKKSSKVVCDLLTDARAEHAELLAALRDMAMAFGHPDDPDVQAWWEYRAEEAAEEGRNSDWYRDEARARAAAAIAKAEGGDK